ncbi:MAG: hypothetical protein V1899_11620, partial [Planctomycetota bacterium]
TKLAAKAEVRCATVGVLLREMASADSNRRQFDLILYDPPFTFSRDAQSRETLEAEMALASRLLYPGHARLILRCEKKIEPPLPSNLILTRHWVDGPHAFLFYQVRDSN